MFLAGWVFEFGGCPWSVRAGIADVPGQPANQRTELLPFSLPLPYLPYPPSHTHSLTHLPTYSLFTVLFPPPVRNDIFFLPSKQIKPQLGTNKQCNPLTHPPVDECRWMDIWYGQEYNYDYDGQYLTIHRPQTDRQTNGEREREFPSFFLSFYSMEYCKIEIDSAN